MAVHKSCSRRYLRQEPHAHRQLAKGWGVAPLLAPLTISRRFSEPRGQFPDLYHRPHARALYETDSPGSRDLARCRPHGQCRPYGQISNLAWPWGPERKCCPAKRLLLGHRPYGQKCTLATGSAPSLAPAVSETSPGRSPRHLVRRFLFFRTARPPRPPPIGGG